MPAATLSLAQWTRYRDILRRLSDKAAEEFRRAVWEPSGRWHGVGIDGIPRGELIEFANALVQKYGEASAAAACEAYDAIAALSGFATAPAVPAQMPEISDVAKAVNGTIKQTADEDTIAGAIGRLVKLAGQDTTLQNASRDRAQVAWIPSGDTCAYCIALASRGWQDAGSAMDAGGHAEHIHANCDCAFSVRFNPSTTVAGYDPAEYKRMYNEAGGNSTNKINAMRRRFYEENKERINAQKRAAYAKRRELESSAAEEADID